MKILIISDTHRKHENLLKVLERECPVDRLIHLGDAEGYEDYIAEQAGCPVEVVAGNNDFFSSLPREKELQVSSNQWPLPYGLREQRHPDPERLAERYVQVAQSLEQGHLDH